MALSVSQAAERLGVNHERVRALIGAGRLEAYKLGGRWLVREDSVERLCRQSRPRGRPFSARRAWGLLLLASGKLASWLSASDVSRLRGYMRDNRWVDLLPRLASRAKVHRLRAHPAELQRLVGDKAVVRTGVSAVDAFGLDLVVREEVDVYLQARKLSGIVRKYVLQPSERANVIVRSCEELWPFDRNQAVAPVAVVGIDLLGADNARARRAGADLLAELDADG